MKFRISTCMAGIALLAAFAIAPVQLTSQSAQTMYKIVPLDTLGGVSGGGSGINNRGWVTGFADQPGDNVSHAALWVGAPQVIDLGLSEGRASTAPWRAGQEQQWSGCRNLRHRLRISSPQIIFLATLSLLRGPQPGSM